MSTQARNCIFVVSVMKLLYKLVEIEFRSLDPSHFQLNNFSTDSEPKCYFNASQAEAPSGMRTATLWLYTGRYLLPVLGGLVSSAWIRCVRVLQIGGIVMLLSTVLLVVSVHFGLMCQDSPIIVITWLLLPVFFGLVQPNIMLAFFCWHRNDKFCTVSTSIYYAMAGFGDLMSGTFLYKYVLSTTVLGNSFTFVFVGASLAYLALTGLLPEIHEEEPFELPTRRRMLKYFQIFSALNLILIFLDNDRPTIYLSEMRYFMNETIDIETQPWLSPDWVKDLALVVLAVPLIIAAVKSRRKLAVKSRILTGILLKCSVDVCLIIVTLVGLSSPAATVAVYSLMSVLDGAAELLVMVAAYDLGCSLLPGSSQCLILGVMFTARAFANYLSRGLFFIIVELNKERNGSKPLLFIYHLIAVLTLTATFFYYKFVILPTADQMMVLSEEDESNGNYSGDELNQEERPLLSVA